MEQYYIIKMEAPLGVRKGSMKFLIEKNRVFGELTILEKTEPFSGNINASGELLIKGVITSAVRTMEYEATGKIKNGEQLVLEIRHKKSIYKVTGYRSHENKSKKGGLDN